MDHFNYKNDQLFAENVAVAELARQYGTPLYVYSRATLERHFLVFNQALSPLPHLICYAVKANSNLAVLNVLARLGAGFDIVSGGELERVLAAGGDSGKIIFSGVGKLNWEIDRALEVGIACFNVESRAELLQLQALAEKQRKTAPIAIRINPDIDVKTHPYIATGLKEDKFGVDVVEALELYRLAKTFANVEIKGIACHIGSQLTEILPFIDAFECIFKLVKQLEAENIQLEHIDMGGGLGVCYRDEAPPLPKEYGKELIKRLHGENYKIILEPGRAIAANAGILVMQTLFLKKTPIVNFAIVDAAMNDLIRPSLYQAGQDIIPVVKSRERELINYDVVGPVCETGDFLGKERELAIAPADLLAIRTTGAYGFTMSSNYNSRPRVAEIMVDGDKAYLVRKRETVKELFANESILP